MHRYITDFLKQGKDDDLFINADKTYFPPWWKFWDRKLKSEYSDGWTREYNEAGELILLKRKKYAIHPSGFGSRDYIEELDLKTLIATSHPNKGITKKVFPDGRCEEIHDPKPDGTQEVSRGHIDREGNLIPYVHLTFKNGKQIACRWESKVKDPDIWKKILKEHSVPLDDKAQALEQASQDFRKGKKIPETEAELRTFKNAEQKARARANKRFSYNTVSDVRAARYHKRRSAGK